jgi:hypothetical protein
MHISLRSHLISLFLWCFVESNISAAINKGTRFVQFRILRLSPPHSCPSAKLVAHSGFRFLHSFIRVQRPTRCSLSRRFASSSKTMGCLRRRFARSRCFAASSTPTLSSASLAPHHPLHLNSVSIITFSISFARL